MNSLFGESESCVNFFPNNAGDSDEDSDGGDQDEHVNHARQVPLEEVQLEPGGGVRRVLE